MLAGMTGGHALEDQWSNVVKISDNDIIADRISRITKVPTSSILAIFDGFDFAFFDGVRVVIPEPSWGKWGYESRTNIASIAVSDLLPPFEKAVILLGGIRVFKKEGRFNARMAGNARSDTKVVIAQVAQWELADVFESLAAWVSRDISGACLPIELIADHINEMGNVRSCFLHSP
ncbi:hypothetical protein [Streptomyces sp. NPDC048243]|uniref:hypothetical protein n=1 Tax=Streptomyces sp. NPDC048243 TaxID=3365522 RepID=UPI00371A6C72